LEGCAKEKNKCQLITSASANFFKVMYYAEQSEEDLKMAIDVCNSLKKKLSIPSEKVGSKIKDLESFVGFSLP